MLMVITSAAAKKTAAEARDDTADSYDDEDDDDEEEEEAEENEYDNDDDIEEETAVKQTVCGRDVHVAKLVADVEFMALVDKYIYTSVIFCLLCIASLVFASGLRICVLVFCR